MIAKLKGQKGSFAIISAILVFVVILAISAYSDMIVKRWTVNEVQAIMDASGSNTLKKTVDLKFLRAEILAIDKDNTADTNGANTEASPAPEKGEGEAGNDSSQQQEAARVVTATDYENKIKKAYLEELEMQLGSNETITELDVQTVDVSFDYDTFGLGESEKPRPQITLDSVSKLKIDSQAFMDNLEGLSAEAYSSRNNSTFTVEYAGKTADGQVELIIRSVTRLVYR